MALETATHINDLVITNPAGGDDLSLGDDHIKLIKQCLKTDLPLTAPATAIGMSVLTSATATAVRSLIGASNNPFRNRVTNGSMAVCQRGNATLIAGAALAYVTDMFYAYSTGSNVGAAQTGAPGFNANLQLTGAAGNTGVGVGTRLLASDTFDFAGKNVTLSAKLSSSASGVFTWTAYYATTADAFGTLLTPTRTSISSGTFTVTGTETTFAATFAMPSAATTGIEIVFTFSALPAVTTLTFTNVQLEEGSIVAADIVFEKIKIQDEKVRCNYHYRRYSGKDGIAVLGAGHQNSTTASRIALPAVDMFRIPTITFGGSVMLDTAGASNAATASTSYSSLNTVALDVTHAAVGAAGAAAMLQLPNGSANFIELFAGIL